MPKVPPPPMQPPPLVRTNLAPPPIQTVVTPVIPPVQPPPIAPPAPPKPPPPPRQTEARSLTGDIQGLIQSDDYPPSALDNNEQGTVHVTLTIGPSGRVVGCSPSGGPSSLQQATCRLLTARARFSPAQDANGNPITSTYSRSITWRIAE
jgi:protein TonB